MLMYSDAQMNRDNQINALRSFIARKVDCIILSALVETGYGPVLEEAKKTKIPVIMIDRDVQASDQGLRLSIMGADFLMEGRKAGLWLADYLKKKGLDDGRSPINIVQLEGTTGSAPAADRQTGFADVMRDHPNWMLARSQSGNFTTPQGKAVMETFLKADRNIQIVYAHNDAMALGAVQAIKEAGLRPGKDIVIIGIDAVKEALEAVAAGEMNCTVEHSPDFGPQVVTALRDLRDGKKLPARIWTIEGVFDETNAAAVHSNRQY